MSRVAIVFASAAGVGLFACSIASIGGTGAASTADAAPEALEAGCVEVDAALSPVDPAPLPKCTCGAGGSARCVATKDMPGAVASRLAPCEAVAGGACVPDAMLRAGGVLSPCRSTFGEGRCLGLCIPEFGELAGVLDRGDGDACAADERCLPCVDARTQRPTGLCAPPRSIVCEEAEAADAATAEPTAPCPHEGPPLVDVTKLEVCGGGGARCVPPAAVPAEVAPMLAPCAGGLCVPEEVLVAGGRHLPARCTSLSDAEGRCMHLSLPAVAAQAARLPASTCEADERCVPCFDPLDGKPTGVCATVSCDAPKEPPKRWKECCRISGASMGRCVPSQLVPEAARIALDDDELCEQGELCAPVDLLDRGPNPPCTAEAPLGGSYAGVCVADCFDFGFKAVALRRGSCAPGQMCLPCKVNGAPSGAPGCQG